SSAIAARSSGATISSGRRAAVTARRAIATRRAPAISRPTVAAVTAVAARSAKSVAASAARSRITGRAATAAARQALHHVAVAATAPVTANCTAVRAIGRGTISAISAVRTIHTERVRARCTSSAHGNGDRQQNKSCYQQAQRNKLWNAVEAVFFHKRFLLTEI